MTTPDFGPPSGHVEQTLPSAADAFRVVPVVHGPADHLVYLHGFRSSSRSVKALKVKDWMDRAGQGARLWQPDLPVSPAQAHADVLRQVGVWRTINPDCRIDFMGSSLGGFYATVLAERVGGRAVLLNPAVTPWRDLRNETGRRKVYFSEQEIEFLPGYLDELEALHRPVLSNLQRYFLLACLGDEVLDARTMLTRYAGCPARVVEGGDHAISDFDDHLPAVMQFVGWGRS